MTKFIPKDDNGVATGDFECYPTELGNSWIFIHKLKDHKFYSYVLSMYKNDDLPRGTVIISPYFYHKYPHIHSLYLHPGKSGTIYGVSGWVHPKYRRRGQWLWYGLLTRILFWGNLKIFMDIGGDRDKKMEASTRKMKEIIKQQSMVPNDGRMHQNDDEMPRDVVYPYIWYNHRVGGLIEKEIKDET